MSAFSRDDFSVAVKEGENDLICVIARSGWGWIKRVQVSVRYEGVNMSMNVVCESMNVVYKNEVNDKGFSMGEKGKKEKEEEEEEEEERERASEMDIYRKETKRNKRMEKKRKRANDIPTQYPNISITYSWLNYEPGYSVLFRVYSASIQRLFSVYSPPT